MHPISRPFIAEKVEIIKIHPHDHPRPQTQLLIFFLSLLFVQGSLASGINRMLYGMRLKWPQNDAVQASRRLLSEPRARSAVWD
jgi:hypothetical protein